MTKSIFAVFAALPLAAFAAAGPGRIPLHFELASATPCPEVAMLYQPPSKQVLLPRDGRDPLAVDVPDTGGAAQPPLFEVLLALDLHTAALATNLPQQGAVFQVMRPTPMPDNTWRSAYLRCDVSEIWVMQQGGFTDATRWYGPYKVIELMSARGGAAPRFR